MKVKFKYGIKSYSGTLDELVYANFEDRSVVIGRMLPVDRERTAQNETVSTYAGKMADFYQAISDGFKEDLKAYTKKMYRLKPYAKKIAGSFYSVYTKMMWSASKDPEQPIDIESLTSSPIVSGTFPSIDTLKTAIENGHLPLVDGYEEFTHSLG